VLRRVIFHSPGDNLFAAPALTAAEEDDAAEPVFDDEGAPPPLQPDNAGIKIETIKIRKIMLKCFFIKATSLL
jgi:hypothetical protein